jgi:hypothetical protein
MHSDSNSYPSNDFFLKNVVIVGLSKYVPIYICSAGLPDTYDICIPKIPILVKTWEKIGLFNCQLVL